MSHTPINAQSVCKCQVTFRSDFVRSGCFSVAGDQPLHLWAWGCMLVACGLVRWTKQTERQAIWI